MKTVVGATTGALLAGKAFASSPLQGGPAAAPGARREISIGGKRVKVVDIHAHTVIPEVWDVIKDTKFASFGNRVRGRNVMSAARVREINEKGIDVQVLSINAFWFYLTDRDLAAKIVRVQDEKLAEWCNAHPGRYVALSSVALQFPDLAAEQLEYAVKKLGARGAAIGGNVEGDDLSQPKYDPFWAKAQELDALVFMHPSGAENLVKKDAFDGKGDLGNIIGDPLETTIFLSHMIYNGTLDRFPGLKICAAHAGGYLPSYLGRSEVACDVRANAHCANTKSPSDYLHSQIFVDSIINSQEGLRHLVAVMGSGHVVYGTDMPFKWPTSVDNILNAPFLNDSQKEEILGGTLAKLLKV
ncbi:MAG TPA: amidohydrolase family protein [Candidatus Dormibacteraeota bacterium]|nr:amidohydrolase family protein [Candidatus Dormibacteraeota bacterium]